jgi:hypothetical protein
MGVDDHEHCYDWHDGQADAYFDLIDSLAVGGKPAGPTEEHFLVGPLAAVTEVLTRLDT